MSGQQEQELQDLCSTAGANKQINMARVQLPESSPLVERRRSILKSKSQWTKLLAFAGYGSTLGSAVPGGYCIGVMNSLAVHINAWCYETLIVRYNLHLSATAGALLWSAIVSVFLVGGAVGSLSGSWAANKFGRKGSFGICGLLFLIGGICFLCCRLLGSVELLLVGRFIVGLASGLTTACLPMYLSEIAPLALRGTLGVFCAVGFTGGVVVGQIFSLRDVFGTAEYWHMALSFYLVLVVACYAPLRLYPESPKWLCVIKGDRQAAKVQLERLRGPEAADVVANEIADMDLEANLKSQASGFGAVLRDSRLLLPLVIVCAYQGGQQLSGINAIFYYSVSIFRRAGLSAADAEWANLAAGCVNLATSLLGPYLMANINRRPLMMFSAFFCTLSLLAFSLMLNFIDSVSWFAIGCIACIYLYICINSASDRYRFLLAQLFEVTPRPAAMSLGSLSSWSCNFIIGMTFPSLQNAWGAFVFLPFSLSCALLFVLTWLYLPETRGRDPSTVAPLMARGFKSKIK